MVKRLDRCYPFLTSYNNTIKFDEDIPHPNLPDSYFRFRKDFQLLRLALMVRVEVTLVEGGARAAPPIMSGGNPSARSRRGTTQAGQEGRRAGRGTTQEEQEVRRGFTVVAYVPAYFLDVSVVCAGDALYQQNAPVVSKEGIKHLATLAARGPVPFDVDRSVVIARPDDAKKVAAHAPLPSLQHVLEDTVIQLAYYDDLDTYVSDLSLRPGDALLRNKEFVLAKAAKLRERVLGLAFLQMVMLDHDQHEALMVGLDTGGAFPLEHPHIYFGDFHVLTQPTMTFGEFEVPVTPPPRGARLGPWVGLPHVPAVGVDERARQAGHHERPRGSAADALRRAGRRPCRPHQSATQDGQDRPPTHNRPQVRSAPSGAARRRAQQDDRDHVHAHRGCHRQAATGRASYVRRAAGAHGVRVLQGVWGHSRCV